MHNLSGSIRGKQPKLESLDLSQYTNPKTDRFKFPKFPHRAEDRVKIKDNTDYRDLWDVFDAEDKRRYTIAEFFRDLEYHDLDFEVEPFTSFIRPKNKDLLPDYGLLAILPLEEILLECEGAPEQYGPIWIRNSTIGLKSKIKTGELTSDETVTSEMVWENLTIKELKEVCTSSELPTTAKNKEGLIARLLEHKVAYPADIRMPFAFTPDLEIKIQGAISVYVDAVRKAASRFPPLIVPFIWEALLDECDDLVGARIKEVTSSQYWLEDMEPSSDNSPLAKLPAGSQGVDSSSRSSAKAGGSGCVLIIIAVLIAGIALIS